MDVLELKRTFVESSTILVCSAIKRTQKHDLCTSRGHLEWLKPGLEINGGLLIPLCESSVPLSRDSAMSSEPVAGVDPMGPWIWHVLPNGPPSARLKQHQIFSNSNISTLTQWLHGINCIQQWIWTNNFTVFALHTNSHNQKNFTDKTSKTYFVYVRGTFLPNVFAIQFEQFQVR